MSEICDISRKIFNENNKCKEKENNLNVTCFETLTQAWSPPIEKPMGRWTRVCDTVPD